MKRALRGALSAAGLVLLATTLIQAQAGSTAQIAGIVTDTSGGVLPGVDVTATQTATGMSRTVVTDAQGKYTLTNLPIGPYRLEAKLSGFRSFVQTGLTLQVSGSPTINIELSLGDLTETISVEAAAPLVDTKRSGIGEVIGNERIIELPLNGRNPTDLIELTGAAVHVPGNDASTRSMQGSSGGRGIAVAGGQTFGTSYMLDGAMHNNPYDNLNLPLPFPDALQEFRVETGALGAGSGVHTGASVNAVTKAGTNEYHGDVFEFLRNHRFNSTSPFSPIVNGSRKDDGLKRNQFGGTLGGPIVQNRVFFFGGYQGTYTRQTPTDNIAFVPTAAMLAGDFSAAASAACNSGRTVTLRGPFVNDSVNPALFSPAALAIAKKLPTSTDPCGRTTFGLASDTDEDQEVGRVDYQLSMNNALFARYIRTSYVSPPPLSKTDNLLASARAGFDNVAHSLTGGENFVISSTMLNAVHVAFNRTNIHRAHEGFFSAPDVGVKMFSFLKDYTVIGVTGAFNLGNAIQTEAKYFTDTYQIGDDVTMVRGGHQITVGANVARWKSFTTANVRAMGNFTVNGQVTGLPLADFLLGNVSQFIQANPNFLDMYQVYTGIYANDQWRATPRMTFNYGLRWEPYFPQQIRNGFIYNFDLDRFNSGIKSTVFRNAPAGFLYPGDAGFIGGKSGMNKRWSNLAPRLGWAWDPTGNERTSIRASYGWGYDFVNAQYHLNTSVAPPWGSDVRIQATSLDDPFRNFPGGNPFPRTFDADAPFPLRGQYLAVDPNTKNTRQQSWNVVFERQIGKDMAASVTYLGNHTDHLWNMKALNPGVFLGTGPCTLPDGNFYPVCSTQQNLDARRTLNFTNPAEARFISGLDFHDASGRQTYNGLLLSFQRRSTDSLSFSGNYTLSKCEGHPTQDLPNIGTGWTDPNNPDYDYGPCSSDRRHIVNVTAGYRTPDLAGVAGAVASDWRVNGILRAQSGAPLTVFNGIDQAMTGIVANQRADLVAGADGYGAKTVEQWLDRAAFALPALGSLGNSPRGGWRGPKKWQLDMVVARMFPIGPRQIEARLEIFNVTNHYNYADPVTNLSAPAFGKILGLAPGYEPRVFQFGLKYTF